MRCFLFIKCSAFNNCSILQRRLFSDFILHRRANNNPPNYFLQMSKNVNKIQSRGIHGRAKGGFGSFTSSSDNKSSEKENKKDEEEDKYKQFAGNKEKIIEEFFERLNKVLQDPSNAKMMNEATREFIKKFNEKSEGSGLSIEKDASAVAGPSKAKMMNEANREFIKKFNEKIEAGLSIEKDPSAESRGIRGRAKGGFGSSTSSSDNKSSEKENKKGEEEDKYKQFARDKKKFKEEFLKRLYEFRWEYSKEVAKDPSKAEIVREVILEFIRKFNEKNEGSGFSIEKDAFISVKFFAFHLILAVITAIFLMTIFFGGMSREHLKLLNTESTINFDQFVRDYLNVGEVQGIYFYPNKELAIATLNPNAVINGKTISSHGVPISTSDRLLFNYSSTQFVHAVRDAEQKLGVDQRENVPILVKNTMSNGRKFLCFLILGLIYFVSLSRDILIRRTFRVISSAAKKKGK
ncbi:unnamed protein product [Meloidogyne enterolobii]|uniref:Uncharacterized protein n=1 Tax=Meloidogyne enterolobii TaxID=390850 RepID=A0ACB1AHX4_MELEN